MPLLFVSGLNVEGKVVNSIFQFAFYGAGRTLMDVLACTVYHAFLDKIDHNEGVFYLVTSEKMKL